MDNDYDRHPEFQSTLPARGATLHNTPTPPAGDISIHAPRTGSDTLPNQAGQPGGFQSTLPARGATRPSRTSATKSVRFQSTLPARGATRTNTMTHAQVDISIHAPRTGSDAAAEKAGVTIEISIHAPRTGSDTGRAAGRGKPQDISIHAPRTGSDGAAGQPRPLERISIHAPRTGSDMTNTKYYIAYGSFQSTLPARGATQSVHRGRASHPHFNPRSPHGERRRGNCFSFLQMVFQSTLPARGATTPPAGTACASVFQSTLPARGATRFHRITVAGKHFNPRSPHGERR